MPTDVILWPCCFHTLLFPLPQPVSHLQRGMLSGIPKELLGIPRAWESRQLGQPMLSHTVCFDGNPRTSQINKPTGHSWAEGNQEFMYDVILLIKKKKLYNYKIQLGHVNMVLRFPIILCQITMILTQPWPSEFWSCFTNHFHSKSLKNWREKKQKKTYALAMTTLLYLSHPGAVLNLWPCPEETWGYRWGRELKGSAEAISVEERLFWVRWWGWKRLRLLPFGEVQLLGSPANIFEMNTFNGWVTDKPTAKNMIMDTRNYGGCGLWWLKELSAAFIW